jgi:hypothetical protein
MDADRIDGIARLVSTRRGFIAGAIALVAGLRAVQRTDAFGLCSQVGGFCAPGLMCCLGTACTYEFGPYVGRCGTVNADGTITPPPPLVKDASTTAATEGQRSTGRKAKRRRRQEDRRAYRHRRKKGRLKRG